MRPLHRNAQNPAMTKIVDRIEDYRTHAEQCWAKAELARLQAAKEGFTLAAELWESLILAAERGEPLARDTGDFDQPGLNQAGSTR